MKSKLRVELTKRDFEVLKFLFEQRAVSHKQIEKRFFSGCHRTVAQKRLSKLAEYGLITKFCAYHDEVNTTVYSATAKGVGIIAKTYKFEITTPDFKSDSVNHDIGLVDMRTRLEKSKMVVEYFSESVLQSCGAFAESEKFRAFSILNSDAALLIQTPKSTYQVALEYEASDKVEARYSKKLVDYYFAPSVDAVLYICGSGRIENLIRKSDFEIGKKFEAKVFTCLESHAKSDLESLTFSNRDGGKFILK